MKSQGMVYLVGAGPGDAGLLTLRGAELLARADVVVYDALVNPDLLRLAPTVGGDHVRRQTRARPRPFPRSNSNQLLIAKAGEGKTVVRLKGGDPYVFGRGGEEAEQLADAGVRFRSRAGRFVVRGGAELRRGSADASRFLLAADLDHRPRGSRQRASSIDWAAGGQNPGHQGDHDGHGRIGQIAETLVGHGMDAGHARGHGPLGHHRPATIHRGHAGQHRRDRGENTDWPRPPWRSSATW